MVSRVPVLSQDVQWLCDANGMAFEVDEADRIVLRKKGKFVRAFDGEATVHAFLAGMIFERVGSCGSV